MHKLLFCLFILIVSAGYADAQESDAGQVFLPPGTALNNNAAIINQTLKQQSLQKEERIEPSIVQVSLVHYNYMEPTQLGILLSVPNNVTGCFDFSPLEYEASFVEKYYFDVKVKSYKRKPLLNANTGHNCAKGNKAISALIVLDQKQLQQKEIRQIRFHHKNFTDTYLVDMGSQSIRLTPESAVIFKPMGLTGPQKDHIMHHFQGGETIVALHVPMATQQDNVAQAVRNLAYQQSLQPVFEKDGLEPDTNNTVFYFVDPNNIVLKGINDDGYTEFGEIQIPAPYLGENGLTQKAKTLKVFVTHAHTKL